MIVRSPAKKIKHAENSGNLGVPMKIRLVQVILKKNIIYHYDKPRRTKKGLPVRRINDGNVLNSPCPAVPEERP